MIAEHWQRVRDQLTALAGMIGESQLDLNRFAKGFAELARIYYDAVGREGRTSVRLRAVLKAFDLRTPKSVLAAFAGDDPEP